MTYDGSPTLEVGFLIDTSGSFDELAQLQRAMDSTEAKVVRDAASIERATSGMIKPGATMQVTTFGNAATKELRSVARETAAAERAGEGMVRQLTRQTETFGKTASEIRNMRAEQRALAAETRGLTELAGRIRGLNSEMVRLEAGSSRGLGAVGSTGKLAGHHVQNLVFQVQDLSMGMAAAAGSSAPLKMALMTLFQQGAQIQGIAMQAGVSVRSLGGEIGGMASRAAMAHPYLTALAVAAGVVSGAIGLIGDSARDKSDMEAYVRSLGVTTKEMRQLTDVTITWGDTAKAVFQVAGRAIWGEIGPAVTSTWEVMQEWLAWIGGGVRSAVNYMIGGFVGAYNVITKNWRTFPAVIGDVFYSAVNAAIDAINTLIRKTVDGLNMFIVTANAVLGKAGLELPTLTAPQIDRAKNDYAGAASEIGEAARAELRKAMGTDWVGDIGSGILDPIMEQRRKNAQERLRKQAEDRGYLDPEKAKNGSGDKLAERLAREAEAAEAQIRNMYALAEAYKISGAAALIAEARVKAESEAIKKRGDIEAMVDRQIRLAIAQRVVDAAKSTAAMRDQVAVQESVNARVAAGNITAERAAELVKDRIADLPLLQAAEAAQQRGLRDEAMKAMTALADQQAVREQMQKAEEQARFNATNASGQDRLAELREELRLVGATNAERNIALATIRATQEAERQFTDPALRAAYIAQQQEIARAIEAVAAAQAGLNAEFERMISAAEAAGDALARSFGRVGGAVGDVMGVLTDYAKKQKEIDDLSASGRLKADVAAKRSADLQLQSFTALASSAKGFFKEHSAGYKAMAAAEKAFALVQLANTAVNVAAGAAKMFATLGPWAFPAVAAMIGVMAALGFSKGGSGASAPPETNQGTGTVLGDPGAKSESIKNAIDALREVDTVMLSYSRQMASSLKTIESSIGGFASLIVRNAGGITNGNGIAEGFKTSGIGSLLSKIPLIGGILGGLFGTKTTLIGSGLSAGPQSLGSILAGGFDADYYSTVNKKKKFLGFSVSNKTKTTYSDADPLLENQFTLILKSFNDAILAAAGPLGAATNEIQQRLNGFVLNIGQIDLKGLTGAEIEEKLTAVFGAAADKMARAAFPMIDQFQRAGEGAFETLVRVASTLEAVTSTLSLLGQNAAGLGIAAKLGLADQFDSVSDFSSAVDSYFSVFYTKQEQAAARTAQMADVFQSLGLTMPTSLAGFRELVEAQNLNTEAGRAAYATLLKLAPAFADLQAAMDGAKSAADIASERADLERQLLELRGDTAALRALQLARLDASNRALQLEIWAIQDAQAAAKAAEELRKAWQSVGDSIMDEVRRIRGLTDTAGANSFAVLMGQFNAATNAARGGDIEAAKTLPQLSQALLAAAADAATSRQELDRIRAQTAASLEATYGLIGGLSAAAASSGSSLLDQAASGQTPSPSNDNGAASTADSIDELREETVRLRADLTAALAQIAANTGAVKRTLENVTSQSGGDAVSTVAAA